MRKFLFVEPEGEIEKDKRQPASYIRRNFYVRGEIRKAVLDITALGVYIGYINGHRLTQEELMPGYTDYKYRVQYQSYKVTSQIGEGKNVVAVILGDGWYRGGLGADSARNCFGERLKLAFRLVLEYTDGETVTIESDEQTLATQDGPLRQNDLKIDEVYDARKEMRGWNRADFDDHLWHGVKLSSYKGEVVAHEGEPILCQETFVPRILHTPNGSTVLDFGQNMTGRMKFRVSGHDGHTVSMLLGETLDENKNFTMKNLKIQGTGSHVAEDLQRLTYTLREGAQEYAPHFLISGFRYVKLENWPEEVKVENFEAVAIYSALQETGSFTCSNELINQFVKNVRWSQKSNFVDVPTDCPTRERVGWTADISVFAKTACYFTDSSRFLQKWFHDYELAQLPDGNLPFAVPAYKKPDDTWGCMGWSNAISNAAMTMYQFYGEKEIIEDVYDTVKRFVEFNIQRAKVNNIKSIIKEWKNRQYIIDTGFHFGEWLEPGSNMVKDFMEAMLYPDIEVTTAWFYETAKQLAQMARLLNKKEDGKRYAALARKLRNVYRERFLKSGGVREKRQCKYVRPLAMHLAEESEAEQIAARLNQMCVERDYRIGTGFLTTWQILDVLSDNGYVETAYKILENTKQPGWLYTVTKGATTTWENWYGIDENNKPTDSLNHYAMGAAVSWLFSHCTGIRPYKPGFEEILIKPMPGGSLSHARAEYKSRAGKIVSSWQREGAQFKLHIETPKGHKTYVELPDGSRLESDGGVQEYQCVLK